MKARLRSNIRHPLADVDPLYRVSLMDIDISGKVKMVTLETIYLVQSSRRWCNCEDLYRELKSMGASPFGSGKRGVSMRLLRYRRQGLLIGWKARGKLTRYKLSEKGENRLMHLWKKFGLLSPPPDWQSAGEDGKIGKELASLRMSFLNRILKDQIDRLQNNRPLRSPKRIRNRPIIINVNTVALRRMEEAGFVKRAFVGRARIRYKGSGRSSRPVS